MTTVDVTNVFNAAIEDVYWGNWEELYILYNDIHLSCSYVESKRNTTRDVALGIARAIARLALIKYRHPDIVPTWWFNPQKDIGWVLSVHDDSTKLPETMIIPEPLCNTTNEVVEMVTEIVGKLTVVARNKETIDRLLVEHTALVKRFREAEGKAVDWLVKKELI